LAEGTSLKTTRLADLVVCAPPVTDRESLSSPDGMWQYPSLLVVLGFLYGFARAADSAIYSTAVAEVAPPEGLGSAQAVQSFAGFAVGAVAPVVAGSILDAVRSSQGWALAFGFNAALAVPAVLCLLWLRRLPEAVRMAAGKR
jgi:MFS family permease